MTESWLVNHRRFLFAGSAAAFSLAFVVSACVTRAGALPLEKRLIDVFFRAAEDHPRAHDIAAFFVGLGASPIVVLTIGVLTWITYRELGPGWAILVPATLLAPLLALVLKDDGEATRVFAEAVAPWKGEPVSSLPSAHSAYGVATFGLASALALARSRLDLAAMSAFAALSVGCAMVTTGAHVPSDVLAGDAIGAGTLLLLLGLRVSVATAGVLRRAAPTPSRAARETRR